MELQVFNNAEFGSVRSIIVNDEPFFVGKDVAEILGYKAWLLLPQLLMLCRKSSRKVYPSTDRKNIGRARALTCDGTQ